MRKKLQCAFCLLGPPASGKGTAGALIKEILGYPSIIPGDIYRRIREENSDLGNLVRESLKDGGFCPDYLTNRIMLEESEKQNQPFVFDGYPRTMVQFEFLMENFVVGCFLHFEAPLKNLIKSATNRIQCDICNKVWSKLMNLEDCCDCVNNNWKERFDDSLEMYPKRYDSYLSLTFPIVSEIEKMPNYKKIQIIGNNKAANDFTNYLKGKF